MSSGKPEVFIVESLNRSDEDADRFEGRRISQMLSLSKKECKYVYIRTKQELREVMVEFRDSEFRYLHLSCHGNERALYTTYNPLPFEELGTIMNGFLAQRRLFVSACAATNKRLARTLLMDTNCLSVMGPSSNIAFGDAAMFWASFYHLMFKEDKTRMTAARIRSKTEPLAKLFETQIELFTMPNGKINVDKFGTRGRMRRGR